MTRPSWPEYFMEAARLASTRSSCLRAGRAVGAVAVMAGRIVATGYNGAPAGVQNCLDRDFCLRTKMGVPSGQRHELCYAVHAEANVITQAAKHGTSLKGASLYCTHQPCSLCAKLIINAGIKMVCYEHPYPDDLASALLEEAGVVVVRYDGAG